MALKRAPDLCLVADPPAGWLILADGGGAPKLMRSTPKLTPTVSAHVSTSSHSGAAAIMAARPSIALDELRESDQDSGLTPMASLSPTGSTSRAAAAERVDEWLDDDSHHRYVRALPPRHSADAAVRVRLGALGVQAA
jgi:hypothetical protein